MKIKYGVALFLLAALVACKEQPKADKTTRYVKVTEVSAGGRRESLSFSGQVREANQVTSVFKVGGQILQLKVNEGDRVQAGQLLAQVDPRDYQVRFDAASAQYRQAKAEYERYRKLYEKNKLPVNTLDKLEAGYQAAKSNFEACQNALNDTRLTAPFSGYISKRFVSRFDNVGPNQPVVSVVDVSALEVRFNVPASLLGAVQQAGRLICDFQTTGLNAVPATLLAVNPKANETDQYEVRLKLDQTAAGLKPGMSARIRLNDVSEQSPVTSIPVSSVFYREQTPRVWKVTQGGAAAVSSHPVKLGNLLPEGRIEVLSGVSASDVLVTAGVNSLVENQEVNILSQTL